MDRRMPSRMRRHQRMPQYQCKSSQAYEREQQHRDSPARPRSSSQLVQPQDADILSRVRPIPYAVFMIGVIHTPLSEKKRKCPPSSLSQAGPRA